MTNNNNLINFMPSLEEFLNMEPEDIAPFLLNYLEAHDEGEIHLINLAKYENKELIEYAGENSLIAAKLITEAWVWLDKEQFIAPYPGHLGYEGVFVTRKGKKFKNLTDFKTYSYGNLIPKKELDPIFISKVIPLFNKGDYDTAIFQAYKEVEVRIRKVTKLSEQIIGVDLARKAFDEENGILTDKKNIKSERQALSHIFAGVLGWFKNPLSHKYINFDNPFEAAEIILFANYLLRVINSRKKK